jgi:hypothetical protein
VKPKNQKEVNGHDTANHIPFQDRNNEREIDGPRRAGVNGREFNHGIRLRELTDRYLPAPGSNRGFNPSVVVDRVVLMLQGGGRSLEDLRELKGEEGLMKLLISP